MLRSAFPCFCLMVCRHTMTKAVAVPLKFIYEVLENSPRQVMYPTNWFGDSGIQLKNTWPSVEDQVQKMSGCCQIPLLQRKSHPGLELQCHLATGYSCLSDSYTSLPFSSAYARSFLWYAPLSRQERLRLKAPQVLSEPFLNPLLSSSSPIIIGIFCCASLSLVFG